VDEQRVGPYKMWHHEHFIKTIENGVLMTDIVSYKPPFGIVGSMANILLIKRKLTGIFAYRKKAIERRFGKYDSVRLKTNKNKK
jgi:ligand-binding SRPBCC domain-containing protein